MMDEWIVHALVASNAGFLSVLYLQQLSFSNATVWLSSAIAAALRALKKFRVVMQG
jgi:hypothetical protein